ncbi:serine hydrolase [Aurantiacibacter zhengii]|uniref:Serine hydrolase n=1 Tax=Aurantiacibacter zhengii TaxID=2307003 RepID=A0A418NW63_9SPHN|nr:serine hydrolase [Aurantiacibacter zhengii]RIV88838.1 serine hydrolase [Aurantiacibacter zhengii]
MIRNAILAVLIVASPAAALAQDAEETARLEQRAEDIVAAMRGEAVYDEVFADNFASAVPEAQFEAIQGQIEAQFGPLIGVETVEAVAPAGARIAIRFERGRASGSFALEADAPYEVTGFRLSEMTPIGDTVAQFLEDVDALPGEVGLLVSRLGETNPLAARNADQQYAIGSTFKLYVLSALAHSIANGERGWSDVVTLTERSFPSGELQRWPQGAPITLQTLATLMISNSDNTATDQLILELGRDVVEAEVVASGHANPEATFPFMTTREMFVLKSGDEVDAGQYLGSDIASRRQALASLRGVERDMDAVLAAFTGGPNMIEVEWLASPDDLASLLQRLVALGDETAFQIMGVNTALTPAMQDEWDYVGYKGGSEPGVLNLSWLLRDEAGDWTVATFSWNNPEEEVDQSTLEMLAMRAVALAREN